MLKTGNTDLLQSMSYIRIIFFFLLIKECIIFLLIFIRTAKVNARDFNKNRFFANIH